MIVVTFFVVVIPHAITRKSYHDLFGPAWSHGRRGARDGWGGRDRRYLNGIGA
jgi:hypothetical protein